MCVILSCIAIRCNCPSEVVRVLSVLKFTAVKREEPTEDGKAPAKSKEVKAKKPGEALDQGE
jgi:hypothetical protein